VGAVFNPVNIPATITSPFAVVVIDCDGFVPNAFFEALTSNADTPVADLNVET